MMGYDEIEVKGAYVLINAEIVNMEQVTKGIMVNEMTVDKRI